MGTSSKVAEALKLVTPQELDTSDFVNGSGYIQLSIATHATFLLKFREIIEEDMPGQLEMFDRNPGGMIGRYLDDAGHPAYSLWQKVASMDGKLRLWGQPYFGANPDKGQQVCLAHI
jgi:hypothetical protein